MPRPKSPDGLQITVPSFLSRTRPTRGQDPVQGQVTGQDGGAVRHISIVETWRRESEMVATENKEQYGEVLYISRPAKWKRWVTFGISLDSWAKFFLTVSLFEAGFAFMFGAGELIMRRDNSNPSGKLKSTLATITTCWGIFFLPTTIIGLVVMWGRWRKSTTAVHIYTLASSFLTVLYLMASILWFWFAGMLVPEVKKSCLQAAGKLEQQEKFTETAKSFYDSCYQVSNVNYWLTWMILWGTFNLAQTYFGLIFVLWGRDYGRRLRLEEASKGMKGLVMLNGDLETSSYMEKDAISVASPTDVGTPYTIAHTPVVVPIKPANARIVTIPGAANSDVPTMPPLPPPAIYTTEHDTKSNRY